MKTIQLPLTEIELVAVRELCKLGMTVVKNAHPDETKVPESFSIIHGIAEITTEKQRIFGNIASIPAVLTEVNEFTVNNTHVHSWSPREAGGRGMGV